jgi:hypothetical protein
MDVLAKEGLFVFLPSDFDRAQFGSDMFPERLRDCDASGSRDLLPVPFTTSALRAVLESPNDICACALGALLCLKPSPPVPMIAGPLDLTRFVHRLLFFRSVLPNPKFSWSGNVWRATRHVLGNAGQADHDLKVSVPAGVWVAVYCGRGMFFHSDDVPMKMFAAIGREISDPAIEMFEKDNKSFLIKQCFFEHLVYITSPVGGSLFLLGVGHETFVDIYAQQDLGGRS